MGSQAGNNYCHTAPFFAPATRFHPAISRVRVTAQQRETWTRGFSHTVVIALDWPNNSEYAAIDLSLFYQLPVFSLDIFLATWF